jgi:hypothetical protein
VPKDDVKARQMAIRERMLELTAQGLTRHDAALRCGVKYRTARAIIDKARSENDPRAIKREGRMPSGQIVGVPRDLAAAFKAAAAARKIGADELRRRVLAVVTRDNLFDALDLESLTDESLRQ